MIRNFQRWLVLILLVALLAACAPVTSQPAGAAPTAIALVEGKGGLAGQVEGASARWPEDEVMVYAAPFTPVNGKDEGFYVLEPNIHPHTAMLPGGYFQMADVEAGTYVLVVGPEPSNARLVVNASGKPQPFSVEAGKLSDLGKLVLAP